MDRSMETSFFVYRAYVERSFDQINIRVLTINHCLDLKSIYEGSIDGQRISLKPQPVEDSCPWQWAPGCLYNSYVLDGQANIVKYNSPYITLYRGKKKITIPLQRVPYRTKGAMAICVPPLYWYTNWAKMIFALEMWKAQGVVHVIIYHHSSTKHVYKVLSQYQKEGFVTIVPWPSLPQTPFEDPNQSLYRLAHSLAHNDCVLRLNTEFGALIDVDEVIMPRNHTLMSFVVENFANSSVGALLFKHHTLALNPNYAGQNFSYDTLNFSGIWDATELEYEGPPKVFIKDVNFM
ncbi:unnamed protein product [Cylicocyclus nassatus]|uniref:Glycosyltransferase family 92 protein n=1 Tax=Cylicocyclus nassatus TaxID=53992 RepID=A0AA36GF73_CYLNA|nr:unnamed protein product [Cylicocyclus nassatus]